MHILWMLPELGAHLLVQVAQYHRHLTSRNCIDLVIPCLVGQISSTSWQHNVPEEFCTLMLLSLVAVSQLLIVSCSKEAIGCHLVILQNAAHFDGRVSL